MNWTAISMFMVFVCFTLLVTRWAALRTRSASDFYTAGGGLTGMQNGLAIAGDRISAASFLGISAMMFMNGYDGLLYALGVLAGWPIILFLIAERLRNLGKYTFADVVSYRLEQTPVRLTSAFGTLTVALMYLVAQMVGAGKLIELLFGISYLYAVMLVGVLMVFYVTFGGMLATTWVQIIKAVLLLSGTSFMAFMVLKHFGFSTEAMFAGATEDDFAMAKLMSATWVQFARTGDPNGAPGRDITLFDHEDVVAGAAIGEPRTDQHAMQGLDRGIPPADGVGLLAVRELRHERGDHGIGFRSRDSAQRCNGVLFLAHCAGLEKRL